MTRISGKLVFWSISLTWAANVWAGVCCLPDESCQVTDDQTCYGASGSFWEGGTSCAPDPCALTGACCAWNGGQNQPICLQVSGYDCALAAEGPGAWWGPGTDCTPDPCSGDVPCCLPDNTCAILAVFDCEAQGGVSLGDDYASCDPNPCPVAYGACCFEWGAQCVMTTEADCAQHEGGIFMGAATTCETIECANRTGACCMPDQSCFVAPEFVCDGAGGEYAGDGTICAGAGCPPVATQRMTWGRIKSRY